MRAITIIPIVLIIGTITALSLNCGSNSDETQSTKEGAPPQEITTPEPTRTHPEDIQTTFSTSGGSLRMLTKEGVVSANPVWGPDNSRIFYEQSGWICSVSAEGGEITRLAEGYAPMVTPDGTELRFLRLGNPVTGNYPNLVRGLKAMAMGLDGTDVRTLANLENVTVSPYIEANGYQEYGKWSPDSWQVALFIDAPGMRLALWNVQDNLLTTIGGLRPVHYPSWSPDCEELAVAGTLDAECDSAGACRPDLWIIDADTGKFHRITSTDSINEDLPVWSPDGLKLTFVQRASDDANFMFSGAASSIWTMNPDGSETKLLVYRYQPPGGSLRQGQLAWNSTGSAVTLVTWGLKAEGDGDIRLSESIWNIGGDTANSWEHLLDATCCMGSIGGIQWSQDDSKIAFEWTPNAFSVEEKYSAIRLADNAGMDDQRICVLDLGG